MTDQTSGDAKVAALRQEIAQTRAELGDTVEALAAKADVKARAQEKVDETKARVNQVVAEAKVAAREKASQAVDSGRELAVELRNDPKVPARRAADRVRTSVRTYPRQWAAIGAVVAVFTLLVARRRRVERTERFSAAWKGQL